MKIENKGFGQPYKIENLQFSGPLKDTGKLFSTL